ncbi:MAG: hypothetical protein HC809_04680 [Gammaproteobacteria bacterium]|nr:hypothetical protein [Gammaproteobacteria bacterium]
MCQTATHGDSHHRHQGDHRAQRQPAAHCIVIEYNPGVPGSLTFEFDGRLEYMPAGRDVGAGECDNPIVECVNGGEADGRQRCQTRGQHAEANRIHRDQWFDRQGCQLCGTRIAQRFDVRGARQVGLPRPRHPDQQVGDE